MLCSGMLTSAIEASLLDSKMTLETFEHLRTEYLSPNKSASSKSDLKGSEPKNISEPGVLKCFKW